MRIVICDDEKCYVDAVVASINRWQAFHKVVSVSITTYHSSEDLLEFTARSVPYDLAFLDIQFPSELSGLALAQRLRVSPLLPLLCRIIHYSGQYPEQNLHR